MEDDLKILLADIKEGKINDIPSIVDAIEYILIKELHNKIIEREKRKKERERENGKADS